MIDKKIELIRPNNKNVFDKIIYNLIKFKYPIIFFVYTENIPEIDYTVYCSLHV